MHANGRGSRGRFASVSQRNAKWGSEMYFLMSLRVSAAGLS